MLIVFNIIFDREDYVMQVLSMDKTDVLIFPT